ncbi:MAG: hydrogenase formation protein HypD [Desulfobacteraceae bacterium]|nr:hydrogenase formation protein HypD [Desulfobacteraceae bacterium]
MSIDGKLFGESFRDPALAQSLVRQIKGHATQPMRLMEVCGTHTMAIFRHGIRALLPPTIALLSGPGCPVCVTDQQEIDGFIALAQRDDVIITTFGDLLRVPGTYTSLQKEKAEGADVRVVYSAMDAVQLAQAHADKTVVFLGVGFETTAPTIAAAILMAQQLGLENFCVNCAHKTVPTALAALVANPAIRIDGFLLPGHVSVIIGMNAYDDFFQKHHTPCAVAGFEPLDILQGIAALARQITSHRPALENSYGRAVTDQGNAKARAVMAQVFEPCDARWRGIGTISGSGLAIRPELARFDAARRFKIAVVEMKPPKGCACGEILIGAKTPLECPLFRKRCTPMDPVGPCMVSSEGTCAAYYRYHS